MNLEDELKNKSRVLSGWINDKQFLFNAVPLEDAMDILAKAQQQVKVEPEVKPEIAKVVKAVAGEELYKDFFWNNLWVDTQVPDREVWIYYKDGTIGKFKL